jgi:hypothetical protein
LTLQPYRRPELFSGAEHDSGERVGLWNSDQSEKNVMADPRSDRPIVETTTEARAGSTPGVTRNVLIIGTILVIILFVIIYLVERS